MKEMFPDSGGSNWEPVFHFFQQTFIIARLENCNRSLSDECYHDAWGGGGEETFIRLNLFQVLTAVNIWRVQSEGITVNIIKSCYHTASSSASEQCYQFCPYHGLIFSSYYFLWRRLLIDGGLNSGCQLGREEASAPLLHIRTQAQGPDNSVSFPSHKKGHLRGDVLSSSASQLRLEKDAALCLVAPLSQHTLAFRVL